MSSTRQVLSVTEKFVDWRVKPKRGLEDGIGRVRLRVVWPFADQRVSVMCWPAQFRISWEKRDGSGYSWWISVSRFYVNKRVREFNKDLGIQFCDD